MLLLALWLKMQFFTMSQTFFLENLKLNDEPFWIYKVLNHLFCFSNSIIVYLYCTSYFLSFFLSRWDITDSISSLMQSQQKNLPVPLLCHIKYS